MYQLFEDNNNNNNIYFLYSAFPALSAAQSAVHKYMVKRHGVYDGVYERVDQFIMYTYQSISHPRVHVDMSKYKVVSAEYTHMRHVLVLYLYKRSRYFDDVKWAAPDGSFATMQRIQSDIVGT